MKKALIIVDMQIMPFIWKDYGGKPLYKERELLETAKSLIQMARMAGAPVYYVLFTETGDSPRAENQPLWQVHPAIAPQQQDKLIIKYHADSFLHSGLKASLEQEKITDLVFCGVQTEYCVDTTVKSAYSHGFNGELVGDAHSTYDTGCLSAEQIICHHNTILSQFATIKTIDKLEF